MKFDRRNQHGSTSEASGEYTSTPGKTTLTERLPPAGQPSATDSTRNNENDTTTPPPLPVPSGPRPSLQMLFRNRAQDPDQVHAAATRGTATAATQLPHLDQIQRSFGKHDVGHVQAHVGADAAASAQEMGAAAYATGNHVVLGAGTDLHTVAHEAAHVVQQRGGVQLKGGVGEVGDAYERNADEVADRVVRGESAADLLPGGGASPGGAVQRKSTGKRGSPGPQGDKGEKGDKGDPGESYDAVYWEEFHGLMSKAAGAWSFIADKQKLAIQTIRREIEKPKKPAIADAVIEGLIIGALQAATGGIAGFVAGRITKAVGDAVAERVAKETSKAVIQAMSTAIVDAVKDGIKGTIRQIVQPKVLKLIQGGTDHADAFFEAQEDAAIDAGKAGEEAVFDKQKDLAALASSDKKAPAAAAEALFRAASAAYAEAMEVQKDLTLKAWYSYKAQLTYGTDAEGGTDISQVRTGMYESSEGVKATGFLTIRVVKQPGWTDLSISLMEKPDTNALLFKNQSVYLPDSTKAMTGRVENKPVGESTAANSPAGGARDPKIPIMVFLQSSTGGYRPIAILRNEVGETRADDVMSSSPAKGSEWFEDMTCWLAAKGGDKIVTESHFLGDKHVPSGGDAAVMKGIDVLLAEVAKLDIKGYVVPDRG